jgi:glycerate 2-kinase
MTTTWRTSCLPASWSTSAPPDSVRYAKEAAEDRGYTALILTSSLEGESKDAGTFFASIAREIQVHGNPVSAPCVVLSAGETTTHIPDSATIIGHGGPGHELVTGFALAARNVPGAAMLSIDSEGTDGTTIAAGGICDSTTHSRAESRGVDLHAALRGHASSEALQSLGDAVMTGNTGTNLCDLNVLFVPALGSEPNSRRLSK